MNGLSIDGMQRVICTSKYDFIVEDTFFRDDFDVVSTEYPDIEKDTTWIDAWSYCALKKPAFYDIVVATNQYGVL